jgi:hypothetical protein
VSAECSRFPTAHAQHDQAFCHLQFVAYFGLFA